MEIDLTQKEFDISDEEDIVETPTRRRSGAYSSYASSRTSEVNSRPPPPMKTFPLRKITVMNFAPPDVVAGVNHQTSDNQAEKKLFSTSYRGFRKQNKLYDSRLYDMIMSTVRVYNSRILVIGCGDGKGVLSLLRDGPASVVFLDNDQLKLDSLKARVESSMGLLPDISYVCSDAVVYVGSGYDFDLVVMIKCIGQIVRGRDPRNRLQRLMNGIDEMLAPGGSLFADYHDYGSGSFRRISEMGLPDIDIATVFGTYASDIDVRYDSFYGHTSLVFEVDLIGDMGSLESRAQSWKVRYYRKDNVKRVSITPYRPSPIVTRVTPIKGIPDDPQPVLRALIRPALKGVKRVPDYRDRNYFTPHDFVCKFDGVGGMLVMNDVTITFESPLRQYTILMDIELDHVIKCNAESVRLKDGSVVTVIVGIVEIDGIAYDPNDVLSLSILSGLDGPLGRAGVIVQSPYYASLVSGNTTQVRTNDNRVIKVPIDGYNLPFTRYGNFLKPVNKIVFDIRGSEVDVMIATLRLCTGLIGDEVTALVPGSFDPERVYEYYYDVERGKFIPLRIRHDKFFSNTVGRCLIDLLALSMSSYLGLGDTMVELYNGLLNKSY